MTSPWIFDRNLILQAGAGTGKTHALVTLALHVLSGATHRRTPIPAARLVALTFTEKAGMEMRSRVLQRLAPLAEGRSLAECGEIELEQSLAELKLPAPSASDWRRIRRDVPQATIGTFHSFCAAQLRRLAGRTELEPGFEVMDDEDSSALFDEVSQDRILALLAEGDAGALALVDEYGLTNDNGTGVTDLVRAILARISEEGKSPGSLDDGRFSDTLAEASFAQAVASVRTAIAGFGAMKKEHLVKFGDAIAAITVVANGLTRDNAVESAATMRFLRKPPFRKPPREAGIPVTAFDDSLTDLETTTAGLRIAPLGRAFVAMTADVERHYSAAKRRHNRVDFADLQRHLRDLLRDDRETRAIVKSRFDALLVDEFQDTSRLQLDVVTLLAESRAEELTPPKRLEPGLLCIVGDRKQSIYEFRGADVAVFKRAREMLEDPSWNNPAARVKDLGESYRSRPALIGLVNSLFRRLMATVSESFEVVFDDADELKPVFAEASGGPLAEVIAVTGETADERREDEARCIAARIDGIVSGAAPVQVRIKSDGSESTRWRAAEGRDIAILFRGLSKLNVYRDALASRGIAHVVVGGGGFYTTREVLDCWALLRAIDDPEDPVASIALLRSPWCSLSDVMITRLSMVDTDGETIFQSASIARLLEQDQWRRAPSPGEVERLDALLRFMKRATPELDRLGARETLRQALSELDYLAVASALPDADAAGANVEKLLGLLERFELRATTARGAIRQLTERVREPPREPEAPSAEESDPRSVRLMTIHQAKGLEFPIVIVPDCVWADPKESKPIAYERDLGLALSIRQGDEDKRVAGPGMNGVRERLNSRGRAEDLRLLYVALTRARDYIIVTGAAGEGFAFDPIAALGPEHVRVVEVSRVEHVSHGLAPSELERSGAPGVTPVRRLPIHRISTTVTRLRDFQECPERYRLRHEVGLTEPGRKREDERLSAAVLGQLAHELMNQAEFQPLGDAALDDLIRANGIDPQRTEVMDVRRHIRAILETPAAMAIRELRPARRLQEVPFQLAVATASGRMDVKGQIDLLTLSADAVRVYDYKLAVAESIEPDAHRFQLTTYGVAAREMIEGSQLPVEAGIVPLLSPDAPVNWTPLSSADLDAHVEELRDRGGELMEALSTGQWPKLPVASCRKLECGFVSRCHGA